MSVLPASVGSNGPYEPEPPQEPICSKCNAKFPNMRELITHQESTKHFACDQCKLCFWTQDALHDHKKKSHRPDSDLQCFGCKAHFDRAALFWRHIEGNNCKVIYPSDIARLREKNLEFARQLDLRTLSLTDVLSTGESHIKAEDTWASYNDGETAPAEPEPEPVPDFFSGPAPVSPGIAHPLHYRIEDFPVLPFTHPAKRDTPAPSSPSPGGERKENVWSHQKSKVPWTPIKYNAVPPPVSYDILPSGEFQKPIQSPSSNTKIRVMEAPSISAGDGPHNAAASGRILDPDHPDYNAAVFHNHILAKFVCPHRGCGKKFGNAVVLTKHLRSPAHTGGRIPCARCRKVFSTVAALISHMETATNCPIRETGGFRRALGQATGGLMDFETSSGRFIIDQNAVQELLRLRSGSMAIPESYVPAHGEDEKDTNTSW